MSAAGDTPPTVQHQQNQDDRQGADRGHAPPQSAVELCEVHARKVIDKPEGRIATALFPDLPWVHVMFSHILNVFSSEAGRPIDEVAPAEIPALTAQTNPQLLHAAASIKGIDASFCPALLAKAKVSREGEHAASGAAAFDCDVLDGYGKSAVHWASASGKAEWICALVSAGANPNIADEKGLTALHEAVLRGHVAAARALLEGRADAARTETTRGRSALHFAATSDSAELVKLLSTAGAMHDVRDRWDGFTPLMSAVAKGKLKSTEALLECGADTETESVMILTPLMVVSILGHVDVARALLRAGADVRHAGIGSLTPLHLAAEKGHADLIELLLEAGADPTARVAHPPPRSTPLHIACRSTRLSCVVALLDGGADETMQDDPQAIQPLACLTGSSAVSTAPTPSSTPFDVVGCGKFAPHQDPEQMSGNESAEEHARRRNPETIALIQEALRRAPVNRAWRRRSWLVMLRAAVASARSGSTRKAELRELGLLLADGGETTAEERGSEQAENHGGVKHVAARLEESASKERDDTEPAVGLKRARRDDDEMRKEAEGVGKRAGDGDVSRSIERERAASTGRYEGHRKGGDHSRIDLRCRGAHDSNGVRANSVGGTERPGSTISDDGVAALRCLCRRLFGLADVEEGAFRRVVSYV